MASKADKFFSKNNYQWLVILLIIVIVLGVGFRFFQLEKKLYWHDEVYTSMRAAGFTRQEIDNNLFQNRIVTAPELQKYQQIKPGSTAVDTIQSLAIEDPQHPPFYFLMARFWMQQFGSSRTASRLLPTLLSLLSLPLMYGLAWELFTSHLIALFATAFIALSPFDILFAQTARQYSLLAVIVIGSSWLLLRAMRLQSWKNWSFYAGAIALGLYTHPFFILTAIAQGSFIIYDKLFISNINPKNYQNISNYFLALTTAIIIYTPWIFVLITNLQRASDTTNWTKISPGFLDIVKLWVLSFTALFIDLDFGFDSISTYLLRLPFLLLIAVAIYILYRQTNRTTSLFIITSIIVPFLILALPDIILGGKRSAVSRYLVSCFPGIQLAVAYFLGTKIQTTQRFWRVVLAATLTASIVSCTISAFADTWWSKDLSYFNAEVAQIINKNVANSVSPKSVIVISDIGDDFTNTGDLISLSYLLDKNVQLLLLSDSPNFEILKGYSIIFTFRISEKLRLAIEEKQGKLEPIFQYGKLWKLL
ncbi:glycosyl transferase family 39 [Oscillatoriales cyanobacterium USR001]|nr:glycosyl transferase family 39 [Oscillatoriales cyanobacterium USR001]